MMSMSQSMGPDLRHTLKAGAKVAVVGAGRSGMAAADLAASKGARVMLYDDKPPSDVLKYECRQVSGGELARADLVVLSPGFPRSRPELEGLHSLVGEVELASWFIEVPMVGITGTNGKSTTVALVGHLFAVAGRTPFVGGNFGVPLSRLALDPGATQVAVVELSSYQLESIYTAKFAVGAILNITPDHLNRYPSFSAYQEAKARLANLRGEAGAMVLNVADNFCVGLGARAAAPVHWFGEGDVNACTGTYLVRPDLALRKTPKGEEVVYDLETTILRGRHNRENQCAAIEMVSILGIDPATIQEGLRTFGGLAHRLEHVRTLDGVEWYNDSKATNLDAMTKALEALPGPKLLIAGGLDKAGDWTAIRERFSGELQAVLAIGSFGPNLVPLFERHVKEVHLCETLEAAVARACAIAKPGEVVLLSPGCASFDQFRDFEDRGAQFRRLVEQLGRVEA
jgi:UDP-N-acetylmuramoylalanine--D-glutamate ligase